MPWRRNRGRRECPLRLLHAPDGWAFKCGQRGALRQTQIRIFRDIAPVASVARQPQVLLMGPSVAAKSVRELRDFAKAKPGRIAMTSSGVGSMSHLTGELFKITAGVDFAPRAVSW